MKNKNPHVSHILEINLAMVFISTSGALGRYIELPVPVIIVSRAILAFVALLFYCKWKGISLRIEKKDIWIIGLTGLLMAVHWVTYFYALKMSNVAIGMLSLFTYPVITSFLEPLLLKTKFQKIHLLLGALVLSGIYLLVPDFDMSNSYTMAVGIGVLSATVYALRNLILKTKVGNYNASLLMCYQMGVVSILLLPALFQTNIELIGSQLPPLLTLALLTTAVGHTLFLNTFKHFSITTASIISSVQPVYGILIGWLFLAEIPSAVTIIGGILILSAVVVESVRTYR